jgi:GNAT superfamily N-acetyltransferase
MTVAALTAMSPFRSTDEIGLGFRRGGRVAESEITVERLTHLDEAEIAQLSALFEEEWEQREVERFFADPDNLLLLARCDGRWCGRLYGYRLQRLDQLRAGVLIYEVDVVEAFRRRGVGRAMVEASKVWAAEVGAFEVWVLTEQSNAPAKALYRSAGGAEDEETPALFVFPLDS